MNVPKTSGLQREVFSLYRVLLREAIKKDRGSTTAAVGSHGTATTPAGASTPATTTTTDEISGDIHHTNYRISFGYLYNDKESTLSSVKEEFRNKAKLVKKNDFRTIEHKIRHGYKQIKLLQMPGVKKVIASSSTTTTTK